MAITGYAICDYAMPARSYTTIWSPALCGYGNMPAHIYATCSHAIWLRQFAGAKICNLHPPNAATAIHLLPQFAGYRKKPATAIRRRQNMQLAGLPATSISRRNALISRPMAGSATLGYCTGWRRNALMLRPMAGGATLGYCT